MKTILLFFAIFAALFAAEPGNKADIRSKDFGLGRLETDMERAGVSFTLTRRNWDLEQVPLETVILRFVNKEKGEIPEAFVDKDAVTVVSWNLGNTSATVVEDIKWKEKKSWAEILLQLSKEVTLRIRAPVSLISSMKLQAGKLFPLRYHENCPWQIELPGGYATVTGIYLSPDPPERAEVAKAK